MATTIQDLAVRLTTLADANKTTLQLIQRLARLRAATHQSASPSASFYADGSEDVQAELTSDISESLRTQDDQYELLRQEIDWLESSGAAWTRRQDQERDREWTRLSVQAAKLEEDLRRARSAFRKAQLQAKRNTELAQQRENHQRLAFLQQDSNPPSSPPSGDEQPPPSARDLFQRSRPGGPHRPTGNAEVDASADVTAALRRTHALMETELSRSRFAQETLEQTSKALEELSDTYTGLDSLLSSSRNLLGSLLRSQKSDTWYLETAFWVLVSTILWLLFRRLLYGPLWWFVWWPLRLVSRVLFAVFGISASKNLSAADSSASSASRPPLVVQPSADKANRPTMGQQGQGIPVGGGGGGAKQQQQQQQQQPLSEEVGRMAEDGQQKNEGQKPSQRGDGGELRESNEPRNPKKRMFEGESGSQKKDEL